MAESEAKTAALALKAEGNELLKAGRLDEAAAKYTEAIALHKDAVFYSNRAAVFLRQRGREAEALRDCEEAIALDPSYTKAVVRAATAEERLGLFAEAAKRLSAVRAASDKDITKLNSFIPVAAALREWAEGYLVLGSESKAEQAELPSVVTHEMVARMAAAAPACSWLLSANAKVLHKQKRFDSALRAARSAAAAAARTSDALAVLNGWCTIATGQLDVAEKQLRAALSLSPDSKQLVFAYKHSKAISAAKAKGNEQYKAGAYAEAISSYEAAVELSKVSLEAGLATLHGNIAAAYMALGQTEAAVKACDSAIAAHPWYAKAFERRAKCHQKDAKNLKLAEKDLVRAQWLSSSSKTLPHTLHAVRTAIAAAEGKSIADSQVVHIEDDEEWPDVVKQAGGRLIVVDFFATWCKPCKNIAPVVDQLSVGYSHVLFVKIDGDKCQELTMQCGVQAFPTFQFFRNGRKLETMSGADPAKLLLKVQEFGPSPPGVAVDSVAAPWLA